MIKLLTLSRALALGGLGLALAIALSAPAIAADITPTTLLGATATAMRLQGSLSLDNTGRLLPADQRAALAPLQAVAAPLDRAMVSGFLGQANQYVTVSGDDGVVGWWNPFDDAWIVTQWSATPRGWALTSTGAVLAADLEPGAGSGDQPAPLDWQRRQTGGMAQTLWAHNAERVAAYKAALQSGQLVAALNDTARQARAWAALPQRHMQDYGGVLQLRERPGYIAYDQLVRRAALSHFSAVAFDPGVQKRITALPDETRRTLRPVMVAQFQGGFTIIEQSPISPGFLLVARVRDGGSSNPAVTGIGAIALFGPGPAQ